MNLEDDYRVGRESRYSQKRGEIPKEEEQEESEEAGQKRAGRLCKGDMQVAEEV